MFLANPSKLILIIGCLPAFSIFIAALILLTKKLNEYTTKTISPASRKKPTIKIKFFLSAML